MTGPTNQHREEASEKEAIGIVRYCESTTTPFQQKTGYVIDALSSRDREIREVLEGLRYRHGCWCELPPNITSPPHTCECDAARGLWERVNLTEPSD